MVYYVAYKAPGELRDRSQIVRRLRALGCRQIRRSFWQLDKEELGAATKFLQSNFTVILKRTREIRKPIFTAEGTCSELGSLVVVAYKIPEQGKKGKVKNLLKRAPCIRLCRGVYAFSQRPERFDRGHSLVDARSFWGAIREIDENAVMVPRMVIVNNQVVETLLAEAKSRIEREVYSVILGYKILFQKVKRDEIDRQRAIRITRRLRRRFLNAKRVAAFYENWLRMDLSNILIRPYPAVREVRSVLLERYGTAR